jgi:hypothetical protein
VLLPELPASSSSSKGHGEPLAVQVVLQVPAGSSSIPAANTAEVRCPMHTMDCTCGQPSCAGKLQQDREQQ